MSWHSHRGLGRDRSIGVCRHNRRAGGESESVRHRAGTDRLVLHDVPPEGSRRTSLASPVGHDAPGTDRGRLVPRDGLDGLDRRHARCQGAGIETSRVDAEGGTRRQRPTHSADAVSIMPIGRLWPACRCGCIRWKDESSPPVEVARTVTDVDGRFTFTGLAPPRHEDHLDRRYYAVLGFLGDRPIGISFFHFDDDKEIVEIRMALETSTLSGKVIDAERRPVAGATVIRYWVHDRPIPGLVRRRRTPMAGSNSTECRVYKTPDGRSWDTVFAVRHPDYPDTSGQASALPADVVVTLPTGCLVTGTVTDSVATTSRQNDKSPEDPPLES